MSTDYYRYPQGGGIELSEVAQRVANDPTRCRMRLVALIHHPDMP